MLTRVVVATEKSGLRTKLRAALSQTGADVIVETMRGKRGLWERMSRESSDLFLVSLSLISEPVEDTISVLRELPDSPMLVVLSGEIEPKEEMRLLAAGCEAVLLEDSPSGQLAQVLETLIEKRTEIAGQKLIAGRDMSKPSLNNFVASSPAMKAFMSLVRRVASSDVSLLFQGETGVGKEHLARAIHAEGQRSEGPFVAVNCAALPEALFESELFGHEEGAFTGASRARRGWFELAHQGTIFLDEIGEMPFHFQVKLLRVLQGQEIQRVGSERTVSIDVRIMAATNQDLEARIEAKEFRQDLYYRLSVMTLNVPPLRERREDIPELAESYIDYFRTRVGNNVDGISPEALDALCRYSWPGNVRELINVIERAVLLCDEPRISLAELPLVISDQVAPSPESVALAPNVAAGDVPEAWIEKPWSEVRKTVLQACERSYLTALLRKAAGRVGETAQLAGMEPRSLYEKMKRHGLCKEDFRRRPGGKS